ncbi:conserved hypothetical protein [Desulforapulum autotrophicum HRM2]|uniref:DUF2293 domain-containing protein n=1 Tax=Desulforapulum autotrophicum (strain ATCC 43914 / DSM 3382 / VKM B-1955 / HRM2) TaxID=177437 RepID=C0QJB9_DESAH|nr:DUF2293 domain-containing protein [Desulforapulum autotrophicum]ACN15932.1 conserved hypothetical protein [Desulforapulum autotrophicum HRM2]
MPDTIRTVLPGTTEQTVTTMDKMTLTIPPGWILLPPGDAALTRRVKQAGPHWQVQIKRGKRTFSKGVWAPESNVQDALTYIKRLRADPAHQRSLDQGRLRRAKKQEAYAIEFYNTVLAELYFHPKFSALAQKLAMAVTAHAVPVGSNTVARTERIPVQDRAKAAIIAWMRHHTTRYDTMAVPRIKGRRRKIRQQLARDSKRILNRYRAGESIARDTCPLAIALDKLDAMSLPIP